MWRDFKIGRSTQLGGEADCPFCKARLAKDVAVGELALALAGSDAGEWGKIVSVSQSHEDQQVALAVDPSNPASVKHFSQKRHLVCRLEDLRLPHWLPPLRLNFLAQFEGLIHGFCGDLEVGSNFQWSDEAAAWMVAGIWQIMLPVTGNQVATAAIGHGLPSHLQSKLADYFDFGRNCLISVGRKKPMPSRQKYGEVEGIFQNALRYSYHWHNR